jgi:hypothetical protein
MEMVVQYSGLGKRGHFDSHSREATPNISFRFCFISRHAFYSRNAPHALNLVINPIKVFLAAP